MITWMFGVTYNWSGEDVEYGISGKGYFYERRDDGKISRISAAAYGAAMDYRYDW